MAHSDLELAYLLTAYGEQVYGLALARTKDADQAEAAIEKAEQTVKEAVEAATETVEKATE